MTMNLWKLSNQKLFENILLWYNNKSDNDNNHDDNVINNNIKDNTDNDNYKTTAT